MHSIVARLETEGVASGNFPETEYFNAYNYEQSTQVIRVNMHVIINIFVGMLKWNQTMLLNGPQTP